MELSLLFVKVNYNSRGMSKWGAPELLTFAGLVLLFTHRSVVGGGLGWHRPLQGSSAGRI